LPASPVVSVTSRQHSLLFNATATTDIYTLSLHDALPIWAMSPRSPSSCITTAVEVRTKPAAPMKAAGMRSPHSHATAVSTTVHRDRKSTRLNSSHVKISYAVFCLKKKKKKIQEYNQPTYT